MSVGTAANKIVYSKCFSLDENLLWYKTHFQNFANSGLRDPKGCNASLRIAELNIAAFSNAEINSKPLECEFDNECVSRVLNLIECFQIFRLLNDKLVNFNFREKKVNRGNSG